MRLTIVALALVGWAVASGQTQPFMGTYDVIRFHNGKAIDNKTLPPGQVMFMELHKDGTWRLRDFLISFEGTWSMKDGSLELVIKTGPAGKLKKRDYLLAKPAPDHTRLVIVAPKTSAGQIEFRWNPNVVQEWNARLQAQMKSATAPNIKTGG